MGLLSIFSRNKQAAAKPGKPARGGRSPARQAPLANTQNPDAADALREVRARARTRLMGATVLLLVGVIGFPLLFETQPRPVPVDLPIEIPSRNAPGVVDASAHAGTRGAAAAATHAASGPAPESVSYDARSSAPAAASAAASQASGSKSAFASLAAAFSPGSSPSTADVADKAAYIAPSMGGKGPAKAPAKPEKADKAEKAEKADKTEKTAAAPSPAAASRPALHTAGPVLPPPPASKASPAALLAGASADKPSDAAAPAGRFVVQVGAFLEDAKVREARGKVEKLGLKTYTQPVDTPTGKRIRVRIGPFATKAEADKAAARIKAEGQAAVVLAL
ncbi:MAG TPA: SPOR domain-containing protein [Burkholderiaceae bacterium]